MNRIVRAFTQAETRPRAIVWTGVALVIAIGGFAVSQLVTSQNWFCNDVCHVVHLDNERAWREGSHNDITCMSCHYPVNWNPVSFTLDRVDKLLDIFPTIAKSFHMPVNEYSHVALTTPTEQCTQCHALDTRVVTPSPGIVINHAVHENAGIPCAVCHNRVAHPENFDLQLPGNEKKADFMTMTACYRCHTLEETSPSGFRATGECSACHTPELDLMPMSHDVAGWFTERGDSRGHAEAALAEAERVQAAEKDWEEFSPEFYGKEPRFFARLAGVEHELTVDVPPPGTINECFTCHARQYCTDCHGVEVPHPEGFVGEHGTRFTPSEDAVNCAICHNPTGDAADDPYTCTLCHHPQWQRDAGSWLGTHRYVVRATGGGECFDCHEQSQCAACHTSDDPASFELY
ncbi:MAG: hypothetical protein Kow0067_00270 [Coriobacteriia bacterium]